MRYINSLVLALITLSFLVGCFAGGGGGSKGGTDYDGVWQTSFSDSTFVVPAPGANLKEKCSKPPVPMTIVNGYGSVRQDTTCWAVYIAAVSGVAGAVPGATAPGTIEIFYDQIGVSMAASPTGDVLNAEVNGGIFTGKCISPQSCAAQSATGGLTMIR